MKNLLFTLLCCFCFSMCTSVESEGIPYTKVERQLWTHNLNIPVLGSICPPAWDCNKLGRLYSFQAAVALADSLPDWQLPTREDWAILEAHINDPNHESTTNFISGADNLKKVDGFRLFPGIKYEDEPGCSREGEWAAHWVNQYHDDPVEGKVVYSRILKAHGNKPHMIYAPVFLIEKQKPYLSLKLVRNLPD